MVTLVISMLIFILSCSLGASYLQWFIRHSHSREAETAKKCEGFRNQAVRDVTALREAKAKIEKLLNAQIKSHAYR